jgi:hypothetical protein
MIIANALKRLFNGLTADVVLLCVEKPNTAIKYWYGDQKELISWVQNQNTRSTPEKYPLVWYVMGEYTEFQGWYTTQARLVVMQDTRLVELNDWRNSNSYEGILEPVKDAVIERMTLNGYVQVMGSLEDRFSFRAIPNYGVEPSNTLNGSNPKGEQSISIDLVDCLAIDFKLRIKANCIN